MTRIQNDNASQQWSQGQLCSLACRIFFSPSCVCFLATPFALQLAARASCSFSAKPLDALMLARALGIHSQSPKLALMRSSGRTQCPARSFRDASAPLHGIHQNREKRPANAIDTSICSYACSQLWFVTYQRSKSSHEVPCSLSRCLRASMCNNVCPSSVTASGSAPAL